MVLIYCSHL